LIDICDPDEESSVAQYRDAALRVAAEIRGRGHTVLFVGGSPLYLKALLRGLFEGPAADWELRRQITLWAREREPGELHARLAAVDPLAASRLHRNDTRRLIRAIEVYESTGRPISESQTQFDAPRDSGKSAFVLAWPRDELGRRIDARVDAMFAAGLVDETRRLLSAEKPLGRTARQAVGYREVIAHLEQRIPLPETIALVKTKTRQFAKRQLTWFRQLPELVEVPLDHPFDPQEVAARVHSAGVKLLARP
jgi:tRNA dimethylallyltransferase